jgi:hypothetical protein
MNERVNVDVECERLTVATWLRFMIGQRDAIQVVAKSRDALWVGLVFVLSAGLAREFDGEYLLREPWYALLPLGASLATSLVLYAIIYLAARRSQGTKLRWWAGYRTFLTFYWMTAPLAWLYALPVERFMTPGQATQANLSLLAIVSIWRVLLITRAISVWLDAGYWRALIIVLFFSNTVLLIANFATPTPIWDVMGGVRLPERESIVLGAKLAIGFFGTMSWLILAIAAAFAVFGRHSWFVGVLPKPVEAVAGKSLWAFAILLIVVGAILLPLAQPEQARRWQAEHLLKTGQLDEVVQFMSNTPRGEFPPQWDPPPRTGYGYQRPSAEDVMAELDKQDSPAWLRDAYVEKVLATYSGFNDSVKAAEKGETKRLEAILAYLERSRGGRSNFPDGFGYELNQVAKEKKVDAALAERIEKLLLNLNREDSN